jgi:hypothetical protein
MLAAFDCADGDRVSHQECFETGLDDEQAAEAFKHGHG